MILKRSSERHARLHCPILLSLNAVDSITLEDGPLYPVALLRHLRFVVGHSGSIKKPPVKGRSEPIACVQLSYGRGVLLPRRQ
jgi:hypothetical protein